MGILYKEDASAVSDTNPLPVRFGRDSGVDFNSTIHTPNATVATQVQAATSGKSIYVTDVVISSSSAMNVQLQDSDSTAVMEQVYLAANTPFTKTFSTPLLVTASKALNVLSSIAAPLSVTVSGFVT